MKLFIQVIFILSAVTVNLIFVVGWKPITGTVTTYRRIQHPSISIVDGSDDTSGITNKNSVTFHGNKAILASVGDSSSISSIGLVDDGSVLTVNAPDLKSEARFLSDGSDYSSSSGKILNGFYPAATSTNDQCSVAKYALENEGTIQYDVAIPKLEQFTLCAWMRFTNHKGDHSIYTYSVDGEPREIQFWVANSKGASYFSLAIHGQSLFRLNYPLKLRKWHHACASWNGKTGEWQLWVKAERVGRGFHNRIVNHIIKSSGILYSGGPSITGPVAPGLHMEVTLLQLYKVALSAGKAHRDHKHHHVHHFNHDGLISTTQPPPPTPLQQQPNFANNPNLANGQVVTRLRINLADAQQQTNDAQPTIQTQQLIDEPTQFINGQFNAAQRLLQQQFSTAGTQIQQVPAPTSPLLFPSPSSSSSFVNLNDPANVQYIDGPSSTATIDGGSRILFKRNENPRKRVKVKRIIKKRATTGSKVNKKRALIALTDGSIIDDKNIADGSFIYDGLSQFGAVDFQESLGKQQGSIEDEIKEHDREAAEDEVKAVLELCSSCEIEPFIGAVVLAWKDAKIQTDHALKGHSIGTCGQF